MDNEQARALMTAHVREQFGRILELRDVAVVRRASGRSWRGELFCVTRWGEVRVGHLAVHEDGHITDDCTIDNLTDALVRVHPAVRSSLRPPPPATGGDMLAGADSPADGTGGNVTLDMGELLDARGDALEASPDLRERAKKLKLSSKREDLEAARDLLPRLLADQESRRYTLVEMSDVELRLNHTDLALQYLEAAAKDFADRAEIRALELVASIALRLLGDQEFDKNPMKTLLEHSRRRIRPIESLAQSPVFAGLPPKLLVELEGLAASASLIPGQIVLKEGDAAREAFVIKSGILSIRLEAPDGTSRLVRCSFPGSLLGETSVLGSPGATCTATVQAESEGSLWRFDGATLRALCTQIPILGTRIESARALHRLDSFFSMHETTQTLDARMRDRILGCVTEVHRARQNELLSTPGEIPSVVYLVAEGSVEYATEGSEARVLLPDSFVGMRDALHEIRTEGAFIAAEDCLLVAFDADRLRAVAGEAPPDVVAVMERLE